MENLRARVSKMLDTFDYWGISEAEQGKIITEGFDYEIATHSFEVDGNSIPEKMKVNCFALATTLDVLQAWNVKQEEVTAILHGMTFYNSQSSYLRYLALMAAFDQINKSEKSK